ncbi:MAG: 4Fe-4S dicluster domain-containing protein [Acidimicrobiales bacterium]|nr:4Fe-4S dicluster domain-containing protein [Acidimicrobiales bacterium]
MGRLPLTLGQRALHFQEVAQDHSASSLPAVLNRTVFDRLLADLRAGGFRLIGPTALDGVIAYQTIHSAFEMPSGYGDAQEAGSYQLVDHGDDLLFGYASTAQSWKRHLYPPHETVLTARRPRVDNHWQPSVNAAELALDGESEGIPVQIRTPTEAGQRTALVGVRPCDLVAIGVLDGVLAPTDAEGDPFYASRRANCFIIAVECGAPADTCFCESMGTGPGVDSLPSHAAQADIVLTEVPGATSRDPLPDWTGPTQLVARPLTPAGMELLTSLEAEAASEDLLQAARQVVMRSRKRMNRTLAQHGIRELLFASLDHEAWAFTSSRCLSCSNCTMACPTCFCASFSDASSIDGTEVRRERRWDSCFSLDFSYLHGGVVRRSVEARYRQWVTHKLAGWFDQFGHSGCVGCGRCITWCPAGIDITEHVAVIRSATAGSATQLATSIAESVGRIPRPDVRQEES